MLQMRNGLESTNQTIEQLNVLEALLAHVRVNKRLLNYIDGSPEARLEADSLRCDCALGRWIHGNGGIIYGEKPLFKELVSRHAEFHLQAAEIVRAVDRGEREGARKLLLQGSYARTSRRINALLARMSLEFEF